MAIATQQANTTKNTMIKIKRFLDYSTTNPGAITIYRASDMILAVHSDTSYRSETKSRRRAGGNFFMSSDSLDPPNNGFIPTIEQIIKTVVYSAEKSKLVALHLNFTEVVPEHHALEEMGHKQPPT